MSSVNVDDVQLDIDLVVEYDDSIFPVVIFEGSSFQDVKKVFKKLDLSKEKVKDGWNLFLVSYEKYRKRPLVPKDPNYLDPEDVERWMKESSAFHEACRKKAVELPTLYYIIVSKNEWAKTLTIPEIMEPNVYKGKDDIEPDNLNGVANLFQMASYKFKE
jgi:hypothetical protein